MARLPSCYHSHCVLFQLPASFGQWIMLRKPTGNASTMPCSQVIFGCAVEKWSSAAHVCVQSHYTAPALPGQPNHDDAVVFAGLSIAEHGLSPLELAHCSKCSEYGVMHIDSTAYSMLYTQTYPPSFFQSIQLKSRLANELKV